MSFTSVLPTCFPRPFSHSYCIPILGPGSVQGAISITKGSANPTKHSYVLIQWKVCPSPFRTSSTLHAFCDPDTSRSRLCIPFNSDLPSLQGSILWVIGSKYFTEDNATSSMSQAGQTAPPGSHSPGDDRPISSHPHHTHEIINTSLLFDVDSDCCHSIIALRVSPVVL